jgi:RNA polymerase sigma-70 factor (ECF subfamily)
VETGLNQELVRLALAERWPQVRFGAEPVMAQIARAPAAAGYVAELALVGLCLAQEPTALRVLDDEIIRPALVALARRGFSAAHCDDAAQLARVRLLMPGAQRPEGGLAGYRGEGPLSAFVAVSLAHAAIRIVTRGHGPPSLPEAELPPSLPADGLREEQRAVLRRAVSQALEALTPRQRAILRFHLLDGRTIEQIAAIYFVRPPTASRWLKQALDAMRTSAMGLLPGELKEAMGDLGLSQIDLSLSRVLGGA